MNIHHFCQICGEQLKFGQQSIVQSCERGLYGIFHKWCYDEAKARVSGTNVV